MTAGTTDREPGIVAPEVRDLGTLGQAMTAWLSEQMPRARNLTVHGLDYPRGAGMSHETILFDATWTEDGEQRERGLVVRIKPSRNTVYQDDMFVEQYRLMKLMHDKGIVPVAEPLWFEEDAALLGAAFFIMEKKAGRVAVSYPPYSQSGWLLDVTPADRRTLWEDSVRQLALIQRVETADAPFLALPGGDEGFDQEVDRWRRFQEWIDPEGQLTLLRQGFDRLLAGTPANRPEGIVWGDARLGNMMIGADNRVSAVMDWEQPSLGGALHDLAWWLTHDHSQTALRGIPRLDGMGDRAETIALWEDVSGKSAANLAWYETFAGFKMECLSVRMTSYRDMPSGNAAVEPGTSTAKALDALGI